MATWSGDMEDDLAFDPKGQYEPIVVDPKSADNLLSHEMDMMPFQARNAIYEEIHGVKSLAPDESPALIEESLHKLSREIDRIKHNYLAYVEATRDGYNHYVHDRDIRLRFLRCELFDVQKAAVRMMKYLDLTRELFGDVALTRPIQLRDMGKFEFEMLKMGECQPMPFRDRSGRRLVVALNNFGMQYPLEVRIRVCLYLMWAVGEDEESQQKGVIGILCWPSKQEAVSPEKFAVMYSPKDIPRHIHLSRRMFESFPIRLVGIHLCFPDKPIYHMLRSGMTLSMGVFRSRLRFHCGESIEIQYHLHGYGIPVDQIPITDTGNIKTKTLAQWIRMRTFLESSRSKEPMLSDLDVNHARNSVNLAIDCPKMNDVIFRGKHACLSHPGNVMFRGLIESRYNEHALATNTEEKVQVTWSIVTEVERKQGRFLVWDDNGCWREMNDRNLVRTKVAGALKDHKRRLKAHQNPVMNQSSTGEFERQDNRKKKRKTTSKTKGNLRCLGM